MVPVAGAVLGGLAAFVLTFAASQGFEPAIASALAIGTLIALTGALHEDGLADCADGLGGGATRERKLEIMRDSRIGTYGTIAIALTLYLRVECLAALATSSVVLAGVSLVAAAAVSRTAALVPLLLLPPARADGSGHAAGRPEPRAFTIAASVAALMALTPILAGADPRAALVALAAAAGVALGASGLAYRQIGGHTGDVAGAVQQIAELTLLLAFAAR
jgi:adenosylcobinamide-GDP ribazoletransferase